MALQLSLLFRPWYAHRIERDLQQIWDMLREIKAKRKAIKIEEEIDLTQFSALSIQNASYHPGYTDHAKGKNNHDNHLDKLSDENHQSLTFK